MFIYQVSAMAVNPELVIEVSKQMAAFRNISKEIKANPDKAAAIIAENKNVLISALNAFATFTGLDERVAKGVFSEFMKALSQNPEFAANYIKDMRNFVWDTLPATQVPLFNEMSAYLEKNLEGVFKPKMGGYAKKHPTSLAYLLLKQAEAAGMLDAESQRTVGPARWRDMANDLVMRVSNFTLSLRALKEKKEQEANQKKEAIAQPATIPSDVLSALNNAATASKSETSRQFAENYGYDALKAVRDVVTGAYALFDAYSQAAAQSQNHFFASSERPGAKDAGARIQQESTRFRQSEDAQNRQKEKDREKSA